MGSNMPDRLYVILQAQFYPQDYEIDDLIAFVDQGNNVFISTFIYNEQVSRFTRAFVKSRNYSFYPAGRRDSDTMRALLNPSMFTGSNSYAYPGMLMESYFEETDSSITHILGWGDNGAPNLIHLKRVRVIYIFIYRRWRSAIISFYTTTIFSIWKDILALSRCYSPGDMG
ncbi:hypothetical protein LWM68_00975 [Niabella sp. W65]|nr:hypothetical protein [Niabella sp. W65]MCH7361478.1 hypothetical protein [Niabella sp. W65]